MCYREINKLIKFMRPSDIFNMIIEKIRYLIINININDSNLKSFLKFMVSIKHENVMHVQKKLLLYTNKR